MNVVAPHQHDELDGRDTKPAMSEQPETEARKIRVMIADDHPIVREGLRKLLNLEDDIDVVGAAADGR